MTLNFRKAKPKDRLKAAPEKMAVTKTKAKQVKVKIEVDVDHQAETKSPRMDNLLGDPHWTDVFLPSPVHALYMSCKPFKQFKAKAPKFLKIVQKVFDLSYLEIDLTLKANDELVKKVCITMT